MGDQENALAEHLEAAAAALAADAGGGSRPSDSSLLQYLGYDDGDRVQTAGRIRLLRAAARFRRLFRLPVPDAPALIFFGGEADPAVLGEQHVGLPLGSLAGSGLSPQRAFESCIGEGIEYLSQFVQADDPVLRGPFSEYRQACGADVGDFIAGVLAASAINADRSIAWVPARGPSGGAMHFPLDLCFRRRASEQDFKPPLKLSTGCAAGPTAEAATLRGLLELVERDAVALWWRGGLAAGSNGSSATAADLLAQLRRGATERKTWFLDITTDLEIPAVAALSARADGYGFCFGFGARLNFADAACAAIFELCQVELGQHVVAAKRQESGDGALNESDLRQFRRGTFFDTRSCALLQPEDGPQSLATEQTSLSNLQDALERLQARDIAVYTIDLTRPQFGIPAVRVLAPTLQLEPCQIVGARLARTIAATGGGAVHHSGMPLL